ncbi:streptophobe family protein [Streptomyces sp. J2-1]|nr:streptophobe family protein [Streptomyces corallincola]MBV2355072.1 streptophobe family protein [Streptomyces corallincola]
MRRSTLPLWLDALISAVAAASWALAGMTAVAVLGLHLLGADARGARGPMTAAAVALAAGGSVTPSADASAFGVDGVRARTAIDFAPLGVSLVGALLIAWIFLRSLRAAGVGITLPELALRSGTLVAVFVAALGGACWAGHGSVTLDGRTLGLDRLPGTGGDTGGGLRVPGLGDLGGMLPGGLGDGIAGGLGDRLGKALGDAADAKVVVRFDVDTGATLLGGLFWCAAVLLIALLASRRTPLPRGWDVVHRTVRPPVSALVNVLLAAVGAGLAAAAYAAVGDDHPGRVAGAALLGAPNGAWLGMPLGLFVPWDGRATGLLGTLLPHPIDQLLHSGSGRPVTLGRLAELDGRVWLLAVGAVLAMLAAGVLAAVRTPVGRGHGRWSGGPGGEVGGGGGYGTAARPGGTARFAGWCALRLGVVTALGLPLLVRLTGVSADASLSVLGVDALGTSVGLHGRTGTALLLGAVWGAGAGAAGALLASWAGVGGKWAVRRDRAGRYGDEDRDRDGGDRSGDGVSADDGANGAGRSAPSALAAPSVSAAPHVPATPHASTAQSAPATPHASVPRRSPLPDPGPADGEPHGAPAGTAPPDHTGPYRPRTPYRPPNPATNPYLRVPEDAREPEDARPGFGPAPDDTWVEGAGGHAEGTRAGGTRGSGGTHESGGTRGSGGRPPLPPSVPPPPSAPPPPPATPPHRPRG